VGLLARAATSGVRIPTTSHVRAPSAATQPITYTQPGAPIVPAWDAAAAVDRGYYSSVMVQRGVHVLAAALASRPFRLGPDPTKPDQFNADSPLARLLSPPPLGPNAYTSAYNLWLRAIKDRIVTGKFGWELERAKGAKPTAPPVGLWPLTSAALFPIPSSTLGQWWSGYTYKIQSGGQRDLQGWQVFLSWRPSMNDWRQFESPLISAVMAIQTGIALETHTYREASQGFTGGTMVTTPPFESPADRRAWQDTFNSRYTGPDNAGRVVFAEAEAGFDETGKLIPPAVTVSNLGQSQTDAQVVASLQAVDDRILRALGVPMSMVGDASQRTFQNADQEHKNFWTGPVLELAREIADDVNTYLAPLFGSDVGWFDFSDVAALQKAPIFAQLTPDLALQAGLIVREDWREDVGLPPLQGDPVSVVESEEPAEEDTPGGAGGSASGGGSSGGSGGGGRAADDADQLSRYAALLDDHSDEEIDALCDDPDALGVMFDSAA
jgi:phage portal protein BeeE